MFALYRKEIQSFLSSIIGIMVMVLFLLLNGLVLFVFPSDYNALSAGYANLDSFFYIAPFIFLFLVPAITMRSFAEEKKIGTLETLLNRPLTKFQVVFSKYMASCTLVFLALLPTICYVYSIYQLGNPKGNIDMGAYYGAFLGLLFLSFVFVSIGIYTSILTNNQIIAFLLAVLACFVFYLGFDTLANLPFFSSISYKVSSFGIHYHYISIRRGVIDLRDILYFFSIASFFLYLSTLSLIKTQK